MADCFPVKKRQSLQDSARRTIVRAKKLARQGKCGLAMKQVHKAYKLTGGVIAMDSVHRGSRGIDLQNRLKDLEKEIKKRCKLTRV